MTKSYKKALSFLIFLILFLTKNIYSGELYSNQNLPKNCRSKGKIPVIYDDKYNIGFCRLEKLHPFDSGKYGKVARALSEHFRVPEKELFYQPKNKISDNELLKFHTPEYVSSLKKSKAIAQITEFLPAAIMPTWILNYALINPMKLATSGTRLATEIALENEDYAINLGGGFHHANRDYGHGFCPFGDIQLAMLDVWKKKPNAKILYIDLDAHQGDGVEIGLKKQIQNTKNTDPRLVVYDVYGRDNFPLDKKACKAREYIQYSRPMSFGTRDKEYLSKVSELKTIIAKEKPDFIFYNAGSDVYKKDRLGGQSLSEQGIIKRDEQVFAYAKENKTSIVMTLSGGYTKESANIISKSIINLLEKTKNTVPNTNLAPLKKKIEYKKYIGGALAVTALAAASYYIYKNHFKKK